MIKIVIEIKEDDKEDFGKVVATGLDVQIKEIQKNPTHGEKEGLNFLKEKMGFNKKVCIVNKCKNENNFKEIIDDLFSI